MIGHSLGSLVLFDLLSGQPRTEEEEEVKVQDELDNSEIQDLDDSFKENLF